MQGDNFSFSAYMAEQLQKYSSIAFPLKSSLARRLFVWKTSIARLHPNPDDEFCDPHIGPNQQIISSYVEKLRKVHISSDPLDPGTAKPGVAPLTVERMYPDGYMILNGHHRWAAALQMRQKRFAIKIVNLTQASDVKKILASSRNTRRASFDLDEVVFRPDDGAVEKAPHFPWNHVYKEPLRAGIPALFHFLNSKGYDIWVYSANYYSQDYIRRYFEAHHARVKGVITGTGRKSKQNTREQLEKLLAEKYESSVHIDAESLVRIDGGNKSFDEFRLSGGESWARDIIDIMRSWDKK